MTSYESDSNEDYLVISWDIFWTKVAKKPLLVFERQLTDNRGKSGF